MATGNIANRNGQTFGGITHGIAYMRSRGWLVANLALNSVMTSTAHQAAIQCNVLFLFAVNGGVVLMSNG